MAIRDSGPWKILWTDEAHFHLNGQVHTYNCPIRVSENPHVVPFESLHDTKVIACCAFIPAFIIGQFF